jgi:hypothetical protein
VTSQKRRKLNPKQAKKEKRGPLETKLKRKTKGEKPQARSFNEKAVNRAGMLYLVIRAMDVVKRLSEKDKILRDIELCMVKLYRKIEFDLYNIKESQLEYATNAHEAIPMFISAI